MLEYLVEYIGKCIEIEHMAEAVSLWASRFV